MGFDAISESTLRVAVVGAGPAGFYAAEALLKDPDLKVEVTLFEKLPTPWGLVRAGVAPDHPKIKTVSRVFEQTAAMDGFGFYGNVEVGRQISHEELCDHHHAVIYTVGAAGDRGLGIPGEDLPGSHSATEFVAWYNGHPDFCESEFDLSCTRAVVIGNGNVALDLARMLMLTPDELAETDIADYALGAIVESRIEEVIVLGRRGPAQAAYTTPELRELGELGAADIVVGYDEIVLDAATEEWLAGDQVTTTAKKNVEVVNQFAARRSDRDRRVVLRFLAAPVEIVGNEKVEGLRVVRNTLVADGGRLRAQASDEEETIEAGLVFRSVGYRGRPIEGVPFDEESATFANEAGRVLGPDGQHLPGVYTAGWIKRGPSGVIGTNKKCARETVSKLLDDASAERLKDPRGSPEDLEQLLEPTDAVDYQGWQTIDEHERGRGEKQGRPRVKLTTTEDLLECAGGVCLGRDG